MEVGKLGGIGVLTLLMGAHCFVLAQVKSPTSRSKEAVALVPFVGCESDGQVGPVKAPQDEARRCQSPKKQINVSRTIKRKKESESLLQGAGTASRDMARMVRRFM